MEHVLTQAVGVTWHFLIFDIGLFFARALRFYTEAITKNKLFDN